MHRSRMLSTLLAAVGLICDVTLPSLREHRLRTILTLLGVTIGTQVVIGIALINRSVVGSFAHTVETIAGRADLQVSNGSAGVPRSKVKGQMSNAYRRCVCGLKVSFDF